MWPAVGAKASEVDRQMWRNKFQETTEKWGASFVKGPESGGQAFKTEKRIKGNFACKHTIVGLNLMIYSTFSASMLKFQLFLNFCLKSGGQKHSPPPPHTHTY